MSLLELTKTRTMDNLPLILSGPVLQGMPRDAVTVGVTLKRNRNLKLIIHYPSNARLDQRNGNGNGNYYAISEHVFWKLQPSLVVGFGGTILQFLGGGEQY